MSNFRTKYLKIACNLLWAVFLLIFVFAFLPKLLIYFMPFVVGMIFAMIANPMVKFLEKRIKIKRKYGSVIMIVLVQIVQGIANAIAKRILKLQR